MNKSDLRMECIAKFGSINNMAKIIGISAQDLYCAFNGKKPFYPKWRRAIYEALGKADTVLNSKEVARGGWDGTVEDLYDIVWGMSLRIKDLEETVDLLRNKMEENE